MKALRFALPLFALALWSLIFYRAGFERGHQVLVKKYTEYGLECRQVPTMFPGAFAVRMPDGSVDNSKKENQ